MRSLALSNTALSRARNASMSPMTVAVDSVSVRWVALALMALDSPFPLASRFSSPVYVQDWVVASGTGKVLLADRGFDVNSFDLDDGNLTIRAYNLLGFAPTLELKQSIVPGFLTLIGTGKFLASSSGPVIFAEPS